MFLLSEDFRNPHLPLLHRTYAIEPPAYMADAVRGTGDSGVKEGTQPSRCSQSGSGWETAPAEWDEGVQWPGEQQWQKTAQEGPEKQPDSGTI